MWRKGNEESQRKVWKYILVPEKGLCLPKLVQLFTQVCIQRKLFRDVQFMEK